MKLSIFIILDIILISILFYCYFHNKRVLKIMMCGFGRRIRKSKWARKIQEAHLEQKARATK